MSPANRLCYLSLGVARVFLGSLLAASLPASATRADDLNKFIANLYGGNGILLPGSGTTSFGELEQLGEALAANATFFSPSSAVSGWTFDLERGVPVKTTESLGPLIAERADTLGADQLNLTLSYTRIDYTRFEGDDLDDLSVDLSILNPNCDPQNTQPGSVCDTVLSRVRVNLDVELEQDVYALIGKYGITDQWEAGLVLPLLRTRARVEAAAAYVPCSECKAPDPFLFANTESPFSSISGRESGIGDVLLRTKYNFLRDRGRWPDLGVVGQVKLATGDEDKLLGTGETNFLALLAASRRYGRITPHANVGYEVTTGSSDFDNFKYIAGFEASLHPRLTLLLDGVGRWEPSGDGVGDHLIDLGVGFKAQLWRSLLLDVNFLIPVNRNEGLRPDFIWSVGFEYTFGFGE